MGVQAAPARRDWASLPAIQRAVGETELTASPRDFVASLAGEHEPDLSLAPLGHQVSLEAPSGLVTGIAVPVRTYAPASELVGRPRRHAPPISAQRQVVFGASEESPAPGVQAAEPKIDSLAGISSELDLPPIGRPVVAIEATAVTQPFLTQVSPSARGDLTFARPIQREVQPPPAVEELRLERVSSAPLETPVAAQRLTLGQARRLGLGAPIPARPGPAVQRSPAEPALDLPLAPRPTPAPAAESDHTSTDPSDAVVQAIAPAAPVPSTAGDATGQTNGPGESAPIALSAQRAVARSLPPLFLRPVAQPSVPIVSSGERSLRAHLTSEGSPEAPMTPAIQRLAGTELSPAGRPFTLPLAEPAPSAQPVSSPWSELAGPDGIERRLDLAPAATWSMPAMSTAASTSELPAMPPAAVQRVATVGVATRTPIPGLGLRTTATPSMGPLQMAPLHTAQPPTVQREEAASEGAVSPATPIAAETPAIAPAATAAAAPTAAGAGAAPAHESEKDLDELARKLQDRISSQIRHELLIERERAGMVTDLR